MNKYIKLPSSNTGKAFEESCRSGFSFRFRCGNAEIGDADAHRRGGSDARGVGTGTGTGTGAGTGTGSFGLSQDGAVFLGFGLQLTSLSFEASKQIESVDLEHLFGDVRRGHGTEDRRFQNGFVDAHHFRSARRSHAARTCSKSHTNIQFHLFISLHIIINNRYVECVWILFLFVVLFDFSSDLFLFIFKLYWLFIIIILSFNLINIYDF